MGGKRYFAAMGQQDAMRHRKLTVRYMRPWPQWAFDAYAYAWIQQSMPRPAPQHTAEHPK